MIIKGTKTIAQYKIAQWVNETFVDGSVSIRFTGDNTAIILDDCNERLEVKYEEEEIKIIK